MKVFQGPVVCLLALLPCILGFPAEPETVQPEVVTTTPESSGVSSTINEIPTTTLPESVTGSPVAPDETTVAPPSNATVIEGSNSTTVVGNTTVTVVGNNTIIVSKPGSQITVENLPSGGVAVNVSRPGQNITISPDGTIITSGPNKKAFFAISESFAFNRPSANAPSLNFPLFQELQHRRRNRYPIGNLASVRGFAPDALTRADQMSSMGLGGLDLTLNPEGPFGGY